MMISNNLFGRGDNVKNFYKVNRACCSPAFKAGHEGKSNE